MCYTPSKLSTFLFCVSTKVCSYWKYNPSKTPKYHSLNNVILHQYYKKQTCIYIYMWTMNTYIIPHSSLKFLYISQGHHPPAITLAPYNLQTCQTCNALFKHLFSDESGCLCTNVSSQFPAISRMGHNLKNTNYSHTLSSVRGRNNRTFSTTTATSSALVLALVLVVLVSR